jgi:DNA-binding NarL/FixJ family response regulator
MIKVILVDDHNIVRDGLKALLQKEQDIKIIAEASSFAELENVMELNIPDVLLLDISLPDKSGIEIAELYGSKYPEMKILILSMYINDEFVMGALKAGVLGYLPKNTTRKEMLEAIRKVNNFEQYFPPKINQIILKQLVKSAKNEIKLPDKLKLLSNREIEVLKFFVEGFSNKEISEKLFISQRTVESHKNHIMQKLELKSTVDMIKFAIKHKIVEL